MLQHISPISGMKNGKHENKGRQNNLAAIHLCIFGLVWAYYSLDVRNFVKVLSIFVAFWAFYSLDVRNFLMLALRPFLHLFWAIKRFAT